MNHVLVVGSVALDTVKTPFGESKDALGGSCVYFGLSAHHFAPVQMVGVVGTDFPQKYVKTLTGLGIDTRGLSVAQGQTFRWHGMYDGNMERARTLVCDLNVFTQFEPKLMDDYKDARFVLLGNASPRTQELVFDQLRNPEFVMMDTMDDWIQNSARELLTLIKKVRVLCVNYGEALMLSQEPILANAINEILHMGVKVLIIKKGEHGAVLATRDFVFQVPAYPTMEAVDPTGAGDSFAGGFLGYVAAHGLDAEHLRRALVYGSVMGSFACEGFGTERMEKLTKTEIETRAQRLIQMISL
jgi:sugar/nucleoside kinase (ribokinase family)